MTVLKDLHYQAAERRPIENALAGRAVIDEIGPTGAVLGDNPEVEIVLTIDVPGREPYTARHRQVVSRFVLHRLGPGTPVPVRVDATDPGRLEIG